jgi:hypothetical protein
MSLSQASNRSTVEDGILYPEFEAKDVEVQVNYGVIILLTATVS